MPRRGRSPPVANRRGRPYSLRQLEVRTRDGRPDVIPAPPRTNSAGWSQPSVWPPLCEFLPRHTQSDRPTRLQASIFEHPPRFCISWGCGHTPDAPQRLPTKLVRALNQIGERTAHRAVTRPGADCRTRISGPSKFLVMTDTFRREVPEARASLAERLGRPITS